ncbi:tetratricopeptide repeat protein [Aeromicrobium tamlense]|uniref:Tetratricopeptide repeat protein n=1 Tax=Aeromicrobium tamlense TaxID=375541 RepID=A0A8I0KNF7_9ACTN|nr:MULTISPECIES: tetratricopeptide repeat protein [Aeromicrobium]MBD1272198.1 tetratricopeptide repeat protein [Aeromicrobium tamlense]NYI38606.1 putative thioredoxin [Aeromicrobium tamlense]
MSFSQPGAFDLSSLAQPRPAAGGGAPAPEGAVYVIDVTEADFQQVVDSSMQHLVVLSVWSPRSPQSVEFNEVLAQATAAYGGALQLAKVDADTNPGIAQALQVQAVPFVVGLVQGRPVPLFQGTVDASEVKRFFDELVRLAQQNGLNGRAQPSGGAEVEAPEEPEDDPRFAAADEAYARGDFAAAVAEYEALLAQSPADAEVAERLAATKLYARVDGADLQEARRAAADAPDDIDAQLLVADLDVTGGHVEDAFLRLIDLVKRTSEDDRERVRQHLLDLFTVVGLADPRVAQARRSLAAALF